MREDKALLVIFGIILLGFIISYLYPDLRLLVLTFVVGSILILYFKSLEAHKYG